jgi:hypothetical protein
MLPPEPADEPTIAREIDQRRVELALPDWRQNGGRPGEGNQRFFELGLRLASAGMSRADVERTLDAEAVHAHTPADRRRQVTTILRSLEDYGRLWD